MGHAHMCHTMNETLNTKGCDRRRVGGCPEGPAIMIMSVVIIMIEVKD